MTQPDYEHLERRVDEPSPSMTTRGVLERWGCIVALLGALASTVLVIATVLAVS